jgi:hypothetical protein
VAAAALALVATATPARAALLLPGTTIPAAPGSGPTGTLLATQTTPFTGMDAQSDIFFSGTLVSRVFQETLANNPLGGLTFAYDFTSSAGSIDAIRRFTVNNFGSFTTDVVYDGTGSQGGTTTPLTFDRTASGGVIGFDFGTPPMGGVAPGTGTVNLVIRTNATLFNFNSGQLIDGAVSTAVALGPTAAPEPGTMAGAVIGLACLGGHISMRRRRKVV